LMSGDPYSLDPTYCGRLLSLGEIGLDALVACAESPHSLLRRNAVAVLGSYPQDAVVLPVLRKAFREDKDATVRTRAFFHLVRRKDQEIVPDLLKILEGTDLKDKRLPPLAAFGLGELAPQESVPALCKAIEGHPADWDLIVACTIALSKAAPATKQEGAALPTLKTLASSLVKEVPRFKQDRVGNPPQPDIPDRPEGENRMLLELATCALSRCGDKQGTAQVLNMVNQKWEDPKSPVGHSNATGPERQGQCEALKWVCPSTQVALIEAFAGMGAEGAARLRQLILHNKTNEHLRVDALHLDPIAKDKKFVSEVALDTDTPAYSAACKSVALRELFNLDEKAGLKVAGDTVATYAADKPMSKANPKGDPSVVTALEILFKAKKLKLGVLKPALARAMKEFTFERPEVSPEGVKPFKFSPPILETICWMLGTLNDKDGVPLLKTVASNPKLPARSEATVALGRIPGDASVQALVELLDDEDGWIRYNAYLGLKQLTGQDHFADWIYGSKADREEAVAAYRALAKKKK
ncbi:MAG TPA: HEAT repeat domain-containing protein, partial [Planctomycetota bacterium]|nr:HEAT repeat domain-containing protein [Planctomycetota bacterium]